MDLKDLVKDLLGELGKVSQSEAVVGGVRNAGQAKVLPLSKVRIGFGTALGGAGGKGAAAGDAGGEGGGAAGAIVIEPRAFVVVGEDGVPHLLALHKGSAVARRGLEITTRLARTEVPELPEKGSE